MARRTWLCAALAVLPLAACTSTPPAPPATSTPVRPAPALKLVAYESCTELATKLRSAARQSVTSYGMAGPEMLERGMPAARQAAGGAKAEDAPAFSGTNVHEQGVDEPDIVKTDGRRIVAVSGDALRVVDPVTRRQTGKLALGDNVGGDAELLLSGDRALVLVRGTGYGAASRLARPVNTRAEVILVDLSGAQPRLISRYRGDGRVVDARQNGTVARVVLSSGPKFAFPYRATSPDAMLAENRDTIDAAPVSSWLPSWEVSTGSATTTGRLGCGAVHLPATYSGTALLRVLTFDLNAPALDDGKPVAVAADGDAVYGSAGALYIANNQNWRLEAVADSAPKEAPNDTEIFRFDLPATGKPVYTAAGKVPGVLLNQYAMSEWDGHLRVATTTGGFGESAVRVLEVADGKLTQVGEVSGLGKGERIYAVRFLGPRAFVVTFRQTDPLYSVDLSDPARPEVTGELKITGYSAHLQPVGADRLVGIGQEVRVDGPGTRVGSQVSLFDVADATQPRRLDQHLVRDGYSEAEHDPHAVLFWPATGLLVLPYSDRKTSGVLALRVTADGLTEAGRITSDGASPVRRSLVIGDQLWTMAEEGLLASNLSTLDRIGWVPMRG